MQSIHLQEGKKVYFASDNHLGAPSFKDSLPREKKFVAWLDSIKEDAGAIFLMGDLFDFWFEYKTVVPKGFTRTLGKLAELTDAGIPITYFVGNHDLWMNGYFEEELNIPVHHKPQQYEINGTSFFIGHGDGLGPGDKGFKRMKKVFTNSVLSMVVSMVAPRFGRSIGATPYRSITKSFPVMPMQNFLGEDKEWLSTILQAKIGNNNTTTTFIFGHRHLPMEIDLNGKSTYTNLGDWISYFTYAIFDGETLNLLRYP